MTRAKCRLDKHAGGISGKNARKDPVDPRLRQCSGLPSAARMQRLRRGSSLTKLRQKRDVLPTRSCGSTCRQRSITTRERGATAPRSAAPICAKKKQLPLKIARRRPRNIPEVKRGGSGVHNLWSPGKLVDHLVGAEQAGFDVVDAATVTKEITMLPPDSTTRCWPVGKLTFPQQSWWRWLMSLL